MKFADPSRDKQLSPTDDCEDFERFHVSQTRFKITQQYLEEDLHVALAPGA